MPPLFKRPSQQFRRHALYWATQLIGWAAYMALFMVVSYLDGTSTGTVFDVILLEFFTGIAISHILRAVILRNQWLDHGIGFTLPRLILASLVLGCFAFLVETIGHDLLFPEADPALRWDPLEHLGRIINWTLLLSIWSFAYFAYIYFVRHRREEIRNLRLETANRENQLNALRAQMNPHFMFNALNGIRALIDENPQQAKQSITQLSAILRNAMATVRRKTVPLGEEIDIVKAYLALEGMRYEERLRVRFELDEGLDREPVPPMLLQTLVENAVRHGVAKLPQGGDLCIGVRRGPDSLFLTVENSGHYEAGRVNGTGIGLRNTRKRLEILYGGRASIRIENRNDKVMTEVEIPLRSSEPPIPEQTTQTDEP